MVRNLRRSSLNDVLHFQSPCCNRYERGFCSCHYCLYIVSVLGKCKQSVGQFTVVADSFSGISLYHFFTDSGGVMVRRVDRQTCDSTSSRALLRCNLRQKKSITLPRCRTLWSVLLYRCGATSRRDSSTYGHRVQSRRTSRVVVRPESSYVKCRRTSRVVVRPESSYVKSGRTSRVVRQESSYVQSRRTSSTDRKQRDDENDTARVKADTDQQILRSSQFQGHCALSQGGNLHTLLVFQVICSSNAGVTFENSNAFQSPKGR